MNLTNPAMLPREKLFAHGPNALSDVELLALFLRTGIKGMPVLDLARHLLDQFDGIRGLLRASTHQVCAINGIGKAKSAQLLAILELANRYIGEELKCNPVINNAAQTKQYLQLRMDANDREVFAVLFLDNRHRVLAYEELFFGTLDGASVYPRVVVKRALQHNAAAVIFAHNHPSGVAEPSEADRHITERLKAALQLIDIRTLDHIVIGKGETCSMAELGWI